MDQIRKDASYSVGMSIGQSLNEQNLNEIDVNSFIEAIQSTFKGESLKFSPQEANEKISLYINKINETRFADNKVAGENFLAENAKKENVTVLPSGLQYEITENGTGEKPSLTSQVTVHYHGTLIDGTIFDSSVDRGTPASFGVNQVIKGWTEALQLMPTGSKWRLYIPEDIAYGANPRPDGPIQPFMALIFDVELISIG